MVGIRRGRRWGGQGWILCIMLSPIRGRKERAYLVEGRGSRIFSKVGTGVVFPHANLAYPESWGGGEGGFDGHPASVPILNRSESDKSELDVIRNTGRVGPRS